MSRQSLPRVRAVFSSYPLPSRRSTLLSSYLENQSRTISSTETYHPNPPRRRLSHIHSLKPTSSTVSIIKPLLNIAPTIYPRILSRSKRFLQRTALTCRTCESQAEALWRFIPVYPVLRPFQHGPIVRAGEFLGSCGLVNAIGMVGVLVTAFEEVTRDSCASRGKRSTNGSGVGRRTSI